MHECMGSEKQRTWGAHEIGFHPFTFSIVGMEFSCDNEKRKGLFGKV
jgi:hypothetical protein